jgi:hypothetical protein
MDKKEGVRFVDDIMKEVAKETPFSLKDIKGAWKIHKEHLESLMDDPDVYSIILPHLGILYFNTYTFKAIFRRSNNKDKLLNLKEKEKKIIQKIKDNIEDNEKKGYITKFTYPQKRKGGIYKLYSNILKFVLGLESPKTSYAPNKKIAKIFEEYSNDKLTKQND